MRDWMCGDEDEATIPRLFRNVMDAASVPVVVIDDGGWYVYANDHAQGLLGYERDALLGRHFTELIPLDAEWLEVEFQRLRASGTWRGTLAMLQMNGNLLQVAANAWARNAVVSTKAANQTYVSLLHPVAGPTSSGETRQPDESYGLTAAELCLVQLMAEGFSDKEIAAVVETSVWTVNKRTSSVLRKLETASRTEACIRALKAGLIV